MRKKLFIALVLFCQFSFAQKVQKLYEEFESQFQNRNYPESVRTLDSLIFLEPFNNSWLYYKARAFSELKDYKQSIAELKSALTSGYIDYEYLQYFESIEEIRTNKEFKLAFENSIRDRNNNKLHTDQQIMTIEVPQLMECYVIMLYLGNPSHTLINKKQNHSYFKKIDEYFKAYKDDPLIKEFASNYPGTDWKNNLRAHHNLRTLYPYDGLNLNKVCKLAIELDSRLANQVKQFAERTDFSRFYNENREFYNAMNDIIRTNYVFGSNIIDFFNNNFEMRINRFNVYYSPIYGRWQHGPTVSIDDYTEAFYFGGIMYTSSKEFYYPTIELLFLLITEFDHTPINSITTSFSKKLSPYEGKTAILNSTGHISYASLEETINEYLTWAFALQFFYEHTPNEYSKLKKHVTNKMKMKEFAKFDEFITFYENNYISQRNKYTKLNDFYSEIIVWISGL